MLLTKRCGNSKLLGKRWLHRGSVEWTVGKALGNVDNALQSVATHRQRVVECVVQRVFHFFLKPGFRK